MAIDLQNLLESLNSLLLFNAKTKLMYSGKRFYELGGKPGRPLARALWETKARSYIPSLTSPSGQKLYKSQEIANCFCSYYEKLYNLTSRKE